jgi:hypothetical protein
LLSLGLERFAIEWRIPASTMAKRGLAGNKRSIAKTLNLRGILREAWKERHAGVRSADLRKITAPTEEVVACFVAGFCMCDDRGKDIRKVVSAIYGALAEWLKKGQPHRKLYDSARTVLRIHRKRHRARLRQSDLWIHLGYGNLNSFVFTGLVLDIGGIVNDGASYLEAVAGRRPVNLWKALQSFNSATDWDMQAWQLSDAPDAIRHAEFLPGLNIQAVQCDPPLLAKIWRRHGPRRRKLAITREPRNIVAAGDACSDDEDDDDEGDGSGHDEGPAELEDRPYQPFDEDDREGDDGTMGPLAAALRALEDIVEEPLDDWDIAESEADVDLPPDESQLDDLGGGDGVGPAPDGPDVFPPPPRPLALVPLDGAAGRPRHGNAGRHYDGQGPLEVIDLPGLARFVLDPATNSIGCHCPYHGRTCRVNRVAHKYPVGYFMAWLQSAPQFTEPEARDLHFRARLQNAEGQPLSLPFRQAGRAAAHGQPELARLFEWEGADGVVEPERM